MIEPYDIDAALRKLTAHRALRDSATVHMVHLGDQMAAAIAMQTPPELLEAAGVTVLLAGAIAGGFAATAQRFVSETERDLAATIINVQCFAGERLIRDARAIIAAGDRG